MTDFGFLLFAVTVLLIILISIQHTLNQILKVLREIKTGRNSTRS